MKRELLTADELSAALEALDRGLVTKAQLPAVSTALQPFGGLR